MPERPASTDAGDQDDDPALDAALSEYVAWVGDDAGEGTRAALQAGLPPVPGDALQEGTRLGEFILGPCLGSGGMGIVFEARQRSVPERRVAVKVARQLQPDGETASRFQREVAAIGRLDHHAIVPILGAGVDRGIAYYAMKSIEGLALDRLLDGARRCGGPPVHAAVARDLLRSMVTPGRDDGGDDASTDAGAEEAWLEDWSRWSARLVQHLADGLQHAHARGVVHRDVKPGNVLVTRAGHPVLVDFGLATHASFETLTRDGAFFGTLVYAAPEQVAGDPLDGRVDVYGLGAILYELLTLARPYDAANRDDLLRQQRARLPATLGARTPPELAAVCLKALATAPSRRYDSPGELARDLRRFLAGESVLARPPGLLLRGRLAMRRHPLAVGITCVAGLILLALMAVDRWRALARVEDATSLMERHDALLRQEATLQADLDALLVPSGLRVRRAEDVMRATALRADRARLSAERRQAQARAEELLLSASDLVAGFPPAHAGLARLYAGRIRQGLREAADLLEPDLFAQWVERLGALDDEGEDQDLLDGTGPARVVSEPPGCRVEISPEGRPDTVVAQGHSPLEVAALAVGRYIARLSMPGRAEVTVPFPVRPRAAGAERDGHHPWSDLHVELLPVERVPDGWVQVAGGWSLVGDDPPVWVHVEGFVMQQVEVTYADWLSFTNEARDVLAARPESWSLLPRFGDAGPLVHLRPDEDGRWQLGPDVHDDRWPVRGVSRTDAYEYRDHRLRSSGLEADGWLLDLPREVEWERAARGADGRLHPWGAEFRWERCASPFGRPDPAAEPWPVPVGTHPEDRSPFGVLDLAGSVAEMTSDAHGPLRDRHSVRGGSYDSRDPRAFTTTHRRAERNEPRPDVGFRLVQRRLPDWALAPAERGGWRDDFERPDGDVVGAGWIELAGMPFQAQGDPSQADGCSLQAGRLVCEGGTGNFSNSSIAWRRADLPVTGYGLQARVSARSTQPPGTRGIALAARWNLLGDGLCLRLTGDGRVVLSVEQPHGGTERDAPGPPLDGDNLLELIVHEGGVEARAWPAAGSRPPEPTVRLDRPSSLAPVRFVELASTTLVGMRLEVEHIEVSVLP